MSKIIFDASALLALINDEQGANKLELLIGNVIMSSINVSEVAGKVYDALGNISEEQCRSYIEPFIHSIIEFDKTQCFMAASLKSQTRHKGLSLGDRACLALGIQLGLPVYTADKVWAELNLPNLEIKLIR